MKLPKILVTVRRLMELAHHSVYIITSTENWYDYYLDLFNLHKDTWIFKLKNGSKLYIKPNSVDRWSAVESLVLNPALDAKHLDDSYDTVIDLGAHIGDSLVSYAFQFKDAKLYGFEPLLENVAAVKKNIELNNLDSRVEVVDKAVSSSNSKKLKLYLNNDSAGGSVGWKRKEGYIDIKNVNFSQLSKLIKGSTLIKIDIEGEEHNLFTKKYLSLLKKFRSIVVEVHEISPELTKKHFERFLRKNNLKYSKERGRFYYINT